jgi:hypothetical protein
VNEKTKAFRDELAAFLESCGVKVFILSGFGSHDSDVWLCAPGVALRVEQLQGRPASSHDAERLVNDITAWSL